MVFFEALGQFDRALLHAAQASQGTLLTALMLAVTFLGNPVFWVGVAAALYWRGQENKGFFMMNLVLFTAAVVGIAKHFFMRPRPSPQEFSVLGSDSYVEPSFPSGHATLIAAAFSYTYKMINRQRKALLAMAVILVAFSRLYLGMHFPADVLAGLALGLVIGKANLFARNKLFHRNFRPTKLEGELALIALIAAGVIAIMFFRSLPMSGLFIGFYAGFFIFKEKQLGQSILLRKMLALKYLAGFAVLAALAATAEGILGIGFPLGEIERFALYALAGLWISLIWPYVSEKALKAKTIA